MKWWVYNPRGLGPIQQNYFVNYARRIGKYFGKLLVNVFEQG